MKKEPTRIDQKKEIALTFQSLFAKPDGMIVLKELSKMCNENEPTFVDQNPTGSAYKEGQRSIIIGIRKQINKTFNTVKQERAEL
jgi:hypothetical protein